METRRSRPPRQGEMEIEGEVDGEREKVAMVFLRFINLTNSLHARR